MFIGIKAKNFLSWETLDLALRPGVTLIEGYNHDDKRSEGSGKSAILNALCWGLYGKLPKDVKIDDVIKQGKKTCEVTIDLEDSVSIHRVRGPNDLYIRKDGNRVKGKDLKETQKLIEDLIGLSFEAFCQCIYFAQNYNKKFLTSNEEEKAKILSEIQELELFDRAREKSSILEKEINQKITVNTVALQKEEQFLLMLNSQVDQHLKFIDKLKNDFQDQKNKLISDITHLKRDLEARKESELLRRREVLVNSLNSINPIIEDLQLELKSLIFKERDLQKIQSNQKRLEDYIVSRESEIQKLLNIKNKECLYCGSEIKDRTHINAHILTLDNTKNSALIDLEKLKSDIPEISNKDILELEVNKHLSFKKLTNEALSQVNRDMLAIEKFSISLAHKENDLRNLKEPDITEYIEIIEEKRKNILHLEATISAAEEDKSNLLKRRQNLNILKDGFRDIKRHVFHNLLLELNRKIKVYLSDLFDVPISLTFANLDEKGNIAKIITSLELNGASRELNLLSGGQLRRCQLATDLALSDIISERKNKVINTLFLDEYFKDLSEESMNKVLTLLENHRKFTIIIEHNSILKNIVNQVVRVEFKEGTSVLI